MKMTSSGSVHKNRTERFKYTARSYLEQVAAPADDRGHTGYWLDRNMTHCLPSQPLQSAVLLELLLVLSLALQRLCISKNMQVKFFVASMWEVLVVWIWNVGWLWKGDGKESKAGQERKTTERQLKERKWKERKEQVCRLTCVMSTVQSLSYFKHCTCLSSVMFWNTSRITITTDTQKLCIEITADWLGIVSATVTPDVKN